MSCIDEETDDLEETAHTLALLSRIAIANAGKLIRPKISYYTRGHIGIEPMLHQSRSYGRQADKWSQLSEGTKGGKVRQQK